jgi:phosphoglycerate dehydrogenase-like enzyme
MKIVIWSHLDARHQAAEALRRIPGIEAVLVEKEEGLAAALAGAAGLVTVNSTYNAGLARLIAANQPGLRWQQLQSAGYENLIAHGVPAGVVITNAGDSRSPSVAEHAIALALAVGRQIPTILAKQGQRRWAQGISRGIVPLEDCTMAVVGFGSIGREVAKRARGLAMRVVAVNRSPVPPELADAYYPLPRLAEALREADHIVVAAAYVPATHHLIDAAAFAAMKRGAFLVNVARGGVIDTAALMRALQDGTLGGAGLDVTDPEPLLPDHPLWACSNLIVSPHVAGAESPASFRRLAALTAENARRLFAGEPLLARLDLPPAS